MNKDDKIADLERQLEEANKSKENYFAGLHAQIKLRHKMEHDNQIMLNFLGELSQLTHFSWKRECVEILNEVSRTSVLKELEELEDTKRKLDSKYSDSISAILDYLWKRREVDGVEEYNKVHEILFKYKSKI